MDPIRPLETYRRVMKWLCLFPFIDPPDEKVKLNYIVFGVSNFMVLLLSIVPSIVFCAEYLATNLADCLFGMLQITGTSSLVYMIFMAFVTRQKLLAIFENLTSIYNARKNLFYLKIIWFEWKAQNSIDEN